MIDTAVLEAAGQGHLARALARLRGAARERLHAQIADLDLPRIAHLFAEVTGGSDPHPDLDRLAPADVIALPRTAADHAREAQAHAAGEQMLREGRVAALLLAGGQGTRLGIDGPKGTFGFSPVTATSLFAHHAARIRALRHRYGCALPWYILTSPQNDAATRAFFAEHDWFGLPAQTVTFFTQGLLPAVDRDTGAILLEAPDRIALSPDGHGGVFPALARHHIFAHMRDAGVDTIVTYNVDNPLLRLGRPEFLGHHHEADSQMTTIVVRKERPDERVGVVGMLDGTTVLIEYSDLPQQLAELRNPDGTLRHWAGSVAAHAIAIDFAERVTDGLPFHRAVKLVPYIDDAGELVTPDRENAIKFEAFMFDALPMARRALSVESLRSDEFSPIKNADGDDSPDTARRDLNRVYARWLREAGIALPLNADGTPTVDIEIDPAFALDAQQLRARLAGGFSPRPGEPIVLR